MCYKNCLNKAVIYKSNIEMETNALENIQLRLDQLDNRNKRLRER
jgi:hypothetical protein